MALAPLSRSGPKILYTDFTVKIQNNGHFSERVDIKKGVHQGGCCSSIYFLVIAEILAISLRSNEDIKGLTLKDIRNLLNQFADDMDIFSICEEKSIREIINELKAFQKQSGFTVSYEKTTLYRIGSLRHSDAQMYDMSTFAWSNRDINVLGVTIAHEDLVEKNYQTIIQKVDSTLKAWYNRGLSLMGKVQVVNTLVASLFVYKMMVLPLIPKNILKNIDNTIRDFIWNGKKSKIAYTTLQLPKQEGGMGLVNLSTKEVALKATWPQILEQEEDYEQLVYTQLRCKHLGRNIWRCTLLPEDVNNMRISNQFWKDTLQCWCQYNHTKNTRIENQLIWFNSYIRIKGKPFLWSDALDKGLIYVHQLFRDQMFKTEDEIKTQYGITTLRYNSLKTAIPAKWTAFFKSNPYSSFCPMPPHEYDSCTQVYKHSVSREIYQYLSGDVIYIQNKLMKWRGELGENFCDSICEFGLAHREIYRLTNVPKYRSFQYRLLQRGLVTNISLQKWKIIPSGLCSFCGKAPETMIHLFVSCHEVVTLWKDLIEYMEKRFQVVIPHPTAEDIILNRLIPTPKYHAINFLCLLTKQFIYRQRCMKGNIHFCALKRVIIHVESIEKYLAMKNNRLNVHIRKWTDRGSENESLGNYIARHLSTQ